MEDIKYHMHVYSLRPEGTDRRKRQMENGSTYTADF
jgi:hypothetical protein